MLLRFYGQLYPAPGANPMSQFLVQVFLETRLSAESLEPLIGFLAYLEPKLWPKIQTLVKICTPTNANLGCIWP